jgi:hypothetical protein
MPTLAQIREQYPQYNDLSDEQLAQGLHQKFYADMPASTFYQKIGYQPSLGWTDVATQAIENIPSSGVRFAKDIAQPFLHPIETAVGLKNIVRGALQKAGIASGTESEQYLDAVGRYLLDRYGSEENLKRTLATDPVGLAADLSMVLTGGETALARAPGLVGRAGEIAGTVGRAINPVTAPLRAAQGIGYGASEIIGGLGTGTGGEAIRTAARAGYEGGEAARAFREQMRGTAPMETVVEEARQAVTKMRQERSVAYRSGMAGVVSDPTVLDFGKIDQAVQQAGLVKTYKGQSLSPSTAGIRQQLQETIEEWRNLPAGDFHTVEGMDALKQKIGDIRDGTTYGTPERVVANNVYHAIRSTIVDQAPDYAKVMRGYELASNEIKEIERELSLNPNANIGTALRKLQSVLRDNVNTSYGNRKVMADYLVKVGAPYLLERLAGQALKPWTARGLGKVGMQLAAAIAGGGELAGHPDVALGAVATLPLQSPRLVGEVAYGLGTAARPLGRAGQVVPSITVPLAPPAARLGDLLQNVNGAQR